MAGRPDTRADLNYARGFYFLGIPGRVFFKFEHGESLKKSFTVDGGV